MRSRFVAEQARAVVLGFGAFIGGLRYGEGVLYTKNAGDHKVFWQGPSVGWDYGADGNRTMMLVYNLQNVDELYRRYAGVSGSAFLVGGVSYYSCSISNDKYDVMPQILKIFQL